MAHPTEHVHVAEGNGLGRAVKKQLLLAFLQLGKGLFEVDVKILRRRFQETGG